MDRYVKYYLNFISLLNQHDVAYLMIGGHAVNLHGYERYTGDLDLWIEPTPNNSKKLIKAIDDFGYDTKILEGVDLNNKSPIKLSEGMYKIEILPNLQGDFSFEEAYNRGKTVKIKGIPVNVINVKDLINNKEKSMRMKDAADAHYLKNILKNKKKK